MLNAILNLLAALFAIAGRYLIRHGKITHHRLLMGTAFFLSVCFLGTYLIYHFSVGGPTPYRGPNALRLIYYGVLFTHIPLAALISPLVAVALILGLTNRISAHRRLVRWVWPLWIYVSVTGVMVYWMLYRLPVGGE